MKTSEQRKLEELYRNMLDGELEALAAEAYHLTNIAKPLLREEIARRGLLCELRESEAAPTPKTAPIPAAGALVVIGKVWTIAEARYAKEILDRASVTCYFGPENNTSEDFDEDAHPEGLELKVKELDGEAAVQALRLAPPLESDPVHDEAFSMKCPQCKSEEVIFQGLDTSDSSPASKFTWTCDACGHEWMDDGLGA